MYTIRQTNILTLINKVYINKIRTDNKYYDSIEIN